MGILDKLQKGVSALGLSGLTPENRPGASSESQLHAQGSINDDQRDNLKGKYWYLGLVIEVDIVWIWPSPQLNFESLVKIHNNYRYQNNICNNDCTVNLICEFDN